jgi:hypothetical protein
MPHYHAQVMRCARLRCPRQLRSTHLEASADPLPHAAWPPASQEATEAIKPILGQYYKSDSRPVLRSLWEDFSATRCAASMCWLLRRVALLLWSCADGVVAVQTVRWLPRRGCALALLRRQPVLTARGALLLACPLQVRCPGRAGKRRDVVQEVIAPAGGDCSGGDCRQIYSAGRTSYSIFLFGVFAVSWQDLLIGTVSCG